MRIQISVTQNLLRNACPKQQCRRAEKEASSFSKISENRNRRAEQNRAKATRQHHLGIHTGIDGKHHTDHHQRKRKAHAAKRKQSRFGKHLGGITLLQRFHQRLFAHGPDQKQDNTYQPNRTYNKRKKSGDGAKQTNELIPVKRQLLRLVFGRCQQRQLRQHRKHGGYNHKHHRKPCHSIITRLTATCGKQGAPPILLRQRTESQKQLSVSRKQENELQNQHHKRAKQNPHGCLLRVHFSFRSGNHMIQIILHDSGPHAHPNHFFEV